MNILIDMNLSPIWVHVLGEAGHKAIHWSQVGDPRAPDEDLFNWAKFHGFIVFTHDLDFGAILAATNADAPSVIQVRTQDVSPAKLQYIVLDFLRKYENQLLTGVLMIFDESRLRLRILPLAKE